MPRTARAAVAGQIYHVLNRGNDRNRVFFDDRDYAAFERLLSRASERHPVALLAACIMPNHFHLLLQPRTDEALSGWMHWLMTSQVRRHHRRHGRSGHVWQGRFKGFPVQGEQHLRTVVRYVERNALRAGLVSRAEDWQWGSLAWRLYSTHRPCLSRLPIDLTDNWVDLVNEPHTPAELDKLRHSVVRGTPFGDPRWQREMAEALDLEHTLRPVGRPPRTATISEKAVTKK